MSAALAPLFCFLLLGSSQTATGLMESVGQAALAVAETRTTNDAKPARDTAAAEQVFTDPAAEEWPPQYYQAWYQAEVDHNVQAASDTYSSLLKSANLSDAQRQTLTARIAECRERILAADPANLCDADVMALVQIRRPGQFVQQLLHMSGVEVADVFPHLQARRPTAPVNWNQPSPMSFVPDHVVASPQLMRCLSAFEGASVVITGLRPEHPNRKYSDPIPTGYLILDPGSNDLMRGVIEMAAQFMAVTEPIGGYPTYSFPENITAVVTRRLVFVGDSRATLEKAITRLTSGSAGSLAESDSYRALRDSRAQANIFAYANAARVLAELEPLIGRDKDFQRIRRLLDLDHCDGAAVALGTIDGGIGLDASVVMQQDHRSIVYNLVRLPALSQDALHCVPADAAALLAIALNPAGTPPTPNDRPTDAALPPIAGLDLFRELFSNVREVAVFVQPVRPSLPGTDSPRSDLPISGALIIAATDPAKSESLWTQLMALPALIAPEEIAPPQESEYAGNRVLIYTFPEVGTLYVTRSENCLIIATDKAAMAGAVTARQRNRSIVDDESMQRVMHALRPDTGLFAYVHAGRFAQSAVTGMAATGELPMSPGMVGPLVGTLSESLDTTTLVVAVAHSNTELNLRACVTGLPNVNRLLQQVEPMMRMFGEHAQQRRAAFERHEPAPPQPRRPKAVVRD